MAPAFAQKREVHHVAWNNFIPPADDVTRDHAAAFEKETGVKIRFETINQNDPQAKASAAIEGGAGPDILQLHWNHAHLYAGGLIDHSAIFELDGGGTVYDYQKEAVLVDGVPRGIPYYGIGNLMAYRTDVYRTSASGFRTTGTSSWPRARSARRKVGPSARPSATPSAMRRSSPMR